MIKFEDLNGKTLIVTQIRSLSGVKEDQIQTLFGLGLGKVNSVSELKCDKSIFGMLVKVYHLIEIKEKNVK